MRSPSTLALLCLALLSADPARAEGVEVRRAGAPGAAREDERAVQRAHRRLQNVRALARHRIVGGDEADKGAFPWAVALSFTDDEGALRQYCGATRIADQWLLTAAHCDVWLSDKAVVGRHDLRTQEGEEVGIAKFIPHADYDSAASDADIALVKLERKPTAGGLLAPIAAGSRLDAAGTDNVVVGWGRTKEGGATSPTLRFVGVPLLANDACQQTYEGVEPGAVRITENMVCAGLPEGGRDSCQGDSGGGLVGRSGDGEAWQQTGVVSFGIGCAQPGQPGVYTRVSRFREWIQQTMAAE